MNRDLLHVRRLASPVAGEIGGIVVAAWARGRAAGQHVYSRPLENG